MVWTRRIAGSWTDTAVGFADTLCIGQCFVRGVAPEFFTNTFVEMLSKSFHQSVCKSLHQNFVVVVSLETFKYVLDFWTDGNDEAADVVLASRGRNVIRQAETRIQRRTLLSELMQHDQWFVSRTVAPQLDVVATSVGVPKADHTICR